MGKSLLKTAPDSFHCKLWHAIAMVGSYLMVVGGSMLKETLVEVLDVKWGNVWSLPHLTMQQP